jgi:hypothetical protein
MNINVNDELGATSLSDDIAFIASRLGIDPVTREGHIDHDRFVRAIEKHYADLEGVHSALQTRAAELRDKAADIAKREALVTKRESAIDAVERLVTLKGKVSKFSFFRSK